MKRTGKLLLISAFTGFLVLVLPLSTALAEEKSQASIDKGATAWMLASSALILLMIPGLALFYGGRVRAKNVLGTMMQSFFCMALVSVQWVLVGYTLAFGEPCCGGLFGGLKYAFLGDVPVDSPFPGTSIPHLVQVTYQMMLAILAPALITGAFAERVRFGAFVLFTLLWTTLVYDPIAHWVWGNGMLSFADGSWLKNAAGAGVLDFAGGTVVHVSSGVSALVFVLLIGKRRGYPAEPILPHNLVLTVLGAGILWFGWFGFNGGSGLDSGGLAGRAFTATQVCAASAALSWAVVEWMHRGTASVLGVAKGLLTGLVCITPASGYVTPMSALVMGIIVAPVCYLFLGRVKARFGYDDSLDVFGVHGVAGTVGALLTGIFCIAGTAGSVRYEAGLKQFTAQAIAVLVVTVYSAIGTGILVKVVDTIVRIRVSDDEELTGLDVTQHGERGYNSQ